MQEKLVPVEETGPISHCRSQTDTDTFFENPFPSKGIFKPPKMLLRIVSKGVASRSEVNFGNE